MKIINIDVKDEIILKNIEDVDTNEITGISSRVYVPTGNYNNIILNFNFNNTKLCEDMDMFANFSIVDGACVDVALEKITVKDKVCQYACFIPAEVFVDECDFFLGLFGYSLNEDGSLKQRVSFVSVKNSVIKGTYDPEATEGTLPSPSVFEVYFQQVKEINEQIENEYQGIIDRLNEIKDEHIEDFNQKIEPEKQNAINDINTQADAKLEEVKADIDNHFEVNGSSYRKDINSNTFRIKRLETDIFDSGEASGTSINIKDSTLSEFQELGVDGTHKQITTTGKNLANDNDIKGKIIGGNSSIPNISVIENETYSITLSQTLNAIGTAGTNNDYIAQHNLKWLDENANVINQNNFLMMTFNSVGETKTLSSSNYVAPTGAKYLKLDVGAYFSNSCKLIHNYIQVEKNTEVTEYEPYSGGQESPNLNWEQPIEVIERDIEVVSCNVNAFNTDLLESTLSYDNTLTIEKGFIQTVSKGAFAYRTLKYLIPKSWIGKQMVFSFRGKVSYASDKTRNQVMLTNINSADNGHYGYAKLSLTEEYFTISFTPESNEIYLTLYSNLKEENENILYIKDVQLQLGTQATPYEPYQETKVTFKIPEGEFFGALPNGKDQIRTKFNEEDGQYHVYLDKKVYEIVFNGNENWFLNSTYEGLTQFSVGLNKLGQYNGGDTLINVISNYFKGAPWHNHWIKDNSIVIKDDGSLRIVTSQFTTIEDLKAHLKQLYDNGTPVKAIYLLKESYEVDLGVVDMPLSYYPVTNVSSNHELQPKINVKYYRDIKNTITTMQTDIEALKQAVSTLTTNQTNLSSEVDLLQEQVSESEVVE